MMEIGKRYLNKHDIENNIFTIFVFSGERMGVLAKGIVSESNSPDFNIGQKYWFVSTEANKELICLDDQEINIYNDDMNKNKAGDFAIGDLVEFCYSGKSADQIFIVKVTAFHIDQVHFTGIPVRAENAGHVKLGVEYTDFPWQKQYYRKVVNPAEHLPKFLSYPEGYRLLTQEEFADKIEAGDMYFSQTRDEFLPCKSVGASWKDKFSESAIKITKRPLPAPIAPPVEHRSEVPDIQHEDTKNDPNLMENVYVDYNFINNHLEPRMGLSNLANKAIYLPKKFVWSLETDQKGTICLVPKKLKNG